MLNDALELRGEIVLHVVIWKPNQNLLDDPKEVLLNIVQQIFDLLNLQRCRFEYIRGTRIVVYNCYGEDLERHLDPDVLTGLVILDGAFKFRNRVVVLVCELPPVRAKLGNVFGDRLSELVDQRLELVVNLG